MLLSLVLALGAQGPNGENSKPPALDDLRREFVETFGDDFDLVGDRVGQDKHGVDHWLVRLAPKRVGFFVVRHVFQHAGDWKYKNNSHEYQISVSPAGVRRFFNYDNSRSSKQACFDMWLGDTIVVPIRLDRRIISHSFTNVRRYLHAQHFDVQSKEYYRRDLEQLVATNSRAAISELVFLGLRTDRHNHRNFAHTVKYYAVLEARAPGRFNLVIEGNRSIPVSISPRFAPLSVLAGAAFLYEWDGGSSGSGSYTLFPMDEAKLRVGDVLFVEVLEDTVRGRQPPRKVGELVFKKDDFALLKPVYDHWLE